MSEKFILDACCGPKEMWTNKNHPNTIYIDIRKENKGFIKQHKNIKIEPDLIMDFRKMNFPDNSFKLVVADPPHLKTLGETSLFRKKYGGLNKETYPQDLKMMFNELWRVLEENGVLIIKWSDYDIKIKELLKYFHTKPLFYQISSAKATSKTYWLCFMKIPEVKII